MGTNETTLLPCPFCGASASMRHGARFSHWVQCDKCGAGHPFAFDTEEGAAAAWNSRAPEVGRTAMSDTRPMAEQGNNAAMRLCDELIQAAYDADICSPSDLAHRVRKIKEAINANAPIGNAAAMREALNQLRDWALLDINENAIRPDETNYQKLVDGIVEITNSALSAPARNCDVLSEEAANEAWDDYRHAHVLPRGGWDFRHIIAWLFAKAKGGDHAE